MTHFFFFLPQFSQAAAAASFLTVQCNDWYSHVNAVGFEPWHECLFKRWSPHHSTTVSLNTHTTSVPNVLRCSHVTVFFIMLFSWHDEILPEPLLEAIDKNILQMSKKKSSYLTWVTVELVIGEKSARTHFALIMIIISWCQKVPTSHRWIFFFTNMWPCMAFCTWKLTTQPENYEQFASIFALIMIQIWPTIDQQCHEFCKSRPSCLLCERAACVCDVQTLEFELTCALCTPLVLPLCGSAPRRIPLDFSVSGIFKV